MSPVMLRKETFLLYKWEFWGIIDLGGDFMENIMGIIENEDPTNLLKTVSGEIANQIKIRIKRDVFIFIFESPRNVLKLMGSSVNDRSVDNYKIHMSLTEGTGKALIENKKTEYFFENGEFLGNEKINLYPIFSGNSFLGAVGIFGEELDYNFIDENTKSFAVLIKLVMENLAIDELRDKVNFIEKLTSIIENTVNIDKLYFQVLEEIRNSLYAGVALFWKFENSKLYISETSGIKSDELKTTFLDISNSYEGKTIQENKEFLIVGKDKFEKYENPFYFDIKSAIYVPLNVDNITIGVIGIYNRKEGYGFRPYKFFDEIDLKFLNDGVKRFGLAISRINLYGKLKDEIEKLRNLKESHEDLIKMQKEQLDKMNALHKISQAIRSTYDKSNAIKIMLLGLTSGRGLRFNRALYLERDRVRGFLMPKLWMGPDDDDDVEQIWKEANRRAIKYGDIVQYLREEAIQIPFSTKLTEKVENKVLAYKGHPVLERVVNKRQIVHVVPHMLKIKKEELEDIYEIIQTEEFLIFPVTGRFDTKGVVIVDNKINKVPVNYIDIEIIRLFQDSIGLALEMIENYEELRQKTKSLEDQKNILDYYQRFKENILQNLALSIVVVDRNEKIVEWNQRSEILFSRPRENILGNSIRFLSGIIGEDIINTIDQIYETKNNLKYPKYKINISGEDKIFDIQFSPLWNRELGVIEGVIIVFDDVTEVDALQQEIERREKLAAIGEMTARIAHEIRNPLTVIGGFLSRMNKKIDDKESVKKYSEIIKGELTRLEEIVSEILEYSRGGRIPRFELLGLNEVIKDVTVMFEDFFVQKNIALNAEWIDDKIEVYGDRSRIKQVLINLIKNAIEVVSDNGKINIKTGTEGKNAFFEIENNGEPISRANQEKLFLPFFTTKTHGTGLGLPICKKIIEEEHGGKLYLVKSDETGTKFKFEIPLK